MTVGYFDEIEAHFALRRGTPFIVSPKDWELMKKWQAEGIPLPVVIEAIDAVFEKNETSGRRKTISSLSYCRHSVKELWQERRALQVGEGSSTPEEGAGPLLDALAEALAESGVAGEMPARVRELVKESSIPRIEERLMELEHEMIDALLAAHPAEAEAIRADVARALAGTTLDEKTRARTEEANLRRLVRERFGLPRMTLF
ncbi:MAG TPA: hypothetical protein VFN10_00105 [Thermoanaerobaculia bacterium]|nr:hypothetical protein [Thermoanaerobaculia bacterium]